MGTDGKLKLLLLQMKGEKPLYQHEFHYKATYFRFYISTAAMVCTP